MTAARGWLRLEGLAVLAVAMVLHAFSDGSWLWFAVLFFVPDLSMLGYLAAGPRTGAWAYNLAHTYAMPSALAGIGWGLGESLPVTVALVWTAHIGFDRALGYGLKLPTDFRDTHLGRIGRSP